uniref:Proteasome subunit beta n=1 Tax=Equus asinus TaxID=9793 RepID=A0A9L0J9G5_EQUAS
MLSSAARLPCSGRDPALEPHGAAGPVQLRFSPYAFNGGTILAIAGEDFSIVASDTRLSEGYSIHTRDSPKCYKLTDKTVIGCSGFHGDCLTLTKIIEARLKMYKHSNNKAMTTGAIAAMLSTILYSRRFFPYYVYNIIGGLDEEAVFRSRGTDVFHQIPFGLTWLLPKRNTISQHRCVPPLRVVPCQKKFQECVGEDTATEISVSSEGDSGWEGVGLFSVPSL